MAFGLNDLGNLYRDEGKYPDSEALYKQAMVVAGESIGATHPDLVGILRDYEILLRKINRIEEADKIESRAKLIQPITL